jgi:hypothetical protein
LNTVFRFAALLIAITIGSANLANAKVFLTNESCSESVFDVIPELYYSTDKPVELFDILSKNVGSHQTQWLKRNLKNSSKQIA